MSPVAGLKLAPERGKSGFTAPWNAQSIRPSCFRLIHAQVIKVLNKGLVDPWGKNGMNFAEYSWIKAI